VTALGRSADGLLKRKKGEESRLPCAGRKRDECKSDSVLLYGLVVTRYWGLTKHSWRQGQSSSVKMAGFGGFA
jgi:hypothetical protein